MPQNIETKCVQGGYTPGNGEPRQIPIIQSTTFKYATSEDMGKLFDLEASGYFYSRLQNPTNDYVAAKIAELEGGTAAMLTSSGQAANFFALFNIVRLRRPHRRLLHHLRRYLQPHLLLPWRRWALSARSLAPDCHGGGTECRFPAQHQGDVRRDHCQSGSDGAGY